MPLIGMPFLSIHELNIPISFHEYDLWISIISKQYLNKMFPIESTSSQDFINNSSVIPQHSLSPIPLYFYNITVHHYEKKLTKNIRPTDILQVYTKGRSN